MRGSESREWNASESHAGLLNGARGDSGAVLCELVLPLALSPRIRCVLIVPLASAIAGASSGPVRVVEIGATVTLPSACSRHSTLDRRFARFDRRLLRLAQRRFVLSAALRSLRTLRSLHLSPPPCEHVSSSTVRFALHSASAASCTPAEAGEE